MSTEEPETGEDSLRPVPERGVGRIESSPFFGHRLGPKPERTLDILRLLDIDPGDFSRLLEPEPAERSRGTPMFERFMTRLHPPPETVSLERKPAPKKPSRLELAEESLERKIKVTLDKMLGERTPTGPTANPARERDD